MSPERTVLCLSPTAEAATRLRGPRTAPSGPRPRLVPPAPNSARTSSCSDVSDDSSSRLSNRIGLGPTTVAQKIESALGPGAGERRSFAHEAPVKLERLCGKLMKCALSAEPAEIQLQAFKYIVDLTTRFPELRRLFVRCQFITGVALREQEFAPLWDRPDLPPGRTGEWAFWRAFAAKCLSDTDISEIMDPSQASHSSEVHEGFGIAERLLAAHQRADSKFTQALSIRYLAASLHRYGFWHSEYISRGGDIAQSACLELTCVLKDFEVHHLPSRDSYDFDGLDAFLDGCLMGMLNWLPESEKGPMRSKSWYPAFTQLVELVRGVNCAERLPFSSARVCSEQFEGVLPAAMLPQCNIKLNVWINNSGSPSPRTAGTSRSSSPSTSMSSSPFQTMEFDDPRCSKCQQSVVASQSEDDPVVRFGDSFFHPSCFACGKCASPLPRIGERTQSAASLGNLLLVLTDADGSTPICTRCAYRCSVCALPILEEALFAHTDGNERVAYHAACFKCRVCRRGIDQQNTEFVGVDRERDGGEWVAMPKAMRPRQGVHADAEKSLRKGACCMRCYNERKLKLQERERRGVKQKVALETQEADG